MKTNIGASIPLVSIIMPAYNCEKYISESINSVLEQTYKNYELIIIEDGSKDQTVDIITDFLKKDNKIKLIKNKVNKGVSYSRNIGINYSSGEWVAFLDSDDMWTSDKLEKQMMYVSKNKNVEFLYTGSSFINENSEPYSWIMEVPQKVKYKDLLKQNIISCSSVLIKKVYLTKYKMEYDSMHEDYVLWLKILKNETDACGINEPLLIYRISSNSKSGNKIKSMFMTLRTYKHVGLNPIVSFYYLVWYIIKGLKKYYNIKNN